MNTETLDVYRGLEEITRAFERGEPLIEVPESVVNGTRAERRDFVRRERECVNPAVKSVLWKPKP